MPDSAPISTEDVLPEMAVILMLGEVADSAARLVLAAHLAQRLHTIGPLVTVSQVEETLWPGAWHICRPGAESSPQDVLQVLTGTQMDGALLVNGRMALVDLHVLRFLVVLLGNFDAAIPRIEGRYVFDHATYARSAIPHLRAAADWPDFVSRATVRITSETELGVVSRDGLAGCQALDVRRALALARATGPPQED